MIQRKQAFHIWEENFRQKDKVKDFAGRPMTKGEYNVYGSKSGWTISTILPESQSGRLTLENVVCCNVKTCMEKGQKFPLFTANDHTFSIKNYGGKYQITEFSGKNEVGATEKKQRETDYKVAAEGIAAWNRAENTDTPYFAGYVTITVTMTEENEVLLPRLKNFIEDLFRIHITVSEEGPEKGSYIFTLVDFDMIEKKETRKLLDHCILFNTYATYFFYPVYGMRFYMYCGMKAYSSRSAASAGRIMNDIYDKKPDFSETLAIDSLIKHNAEVTGHLKSKADKDGYFPYNTCLTKTKISLKQIDEKRRKKNR